MWLLTETQRTYRDHLTILSVNYLIIRVRSLGINQETGKTEKLTGIDFDRNVNEYYYDPMSIAYEFKIDFDGLMISLYNNYHSGFTDLADTDRFLECFQLFDRYNSLNIQSDKDCAHLVLAVSMTNRNPSDGKNEKNRLGIMNLYSKYTKYDNFRLKEEESLDYKYKLLEMSILSKQKEIELKEVDEIINDSFKTATFGNRSNSSSLTRNNEPNYSRRTDNTRNQLDMEMSRRRPVLSSQSQNEPESQSQDSIGAYLDEIADVDLYSNTNQSQ